MTHLEWLGFGCRLRTVPAPLCVKKGSWHAVCPVASRIQCQSADVPPTERLDETVTAFPEGRHLSSRSNNTTRSSLLWRGFWLLMLAGHARAVVAAWIGAAEGVDPVRIIILSLATLFFALKLADVAWLRFRTNARSIAALALIVALLHLNTVGIAGGEMIPQVLATASAVLFLEPVQRRFDLAFERVAALFDAGATNHDSSRALRLLETLTELVRRTPQWRIAHTATPPRAPPC